MPLLEAKNIKKSFDKTEVLKNISFDLEKGQVLAIIGSSGSGKTTLLRCLNYLEIADSGKITVDGDVIFDDDTHKLKDQEIRERRLRFGLVFQSFNLFPQYTALKNVTLALELKLSKKLSSHEKKEELLKIEEKGKHLLDTVGLSDKYYNYPCQLSGGQCQRVAIARALALSPDILCFDEPTSALDPELTGEVLKVIKELKTSDRTMIIVTHEMDFARNVADKIIFMSDGVIEEEGSPEEIFENPKSLRLQEFLAKPTF
ncbi:MAG: amino acid ABC transporter ATP-binding protein [Ruminococcaceae bacterium]|nr:amino acid ABC transporter ATP-binding protein [Oscillospiraceae bacterium]